MVENIELTGSENDSVNLNVFMLKPGQEKIAGKRLKEELSKAIA